MKAEDIIFNKKWNKSKFLWLRKDGIIKKVENDHYRETYEETKNHINYFFTLSDLKRTLKKANNLRSPDGHSNNSMRLEEYTIIK